VEHVDGRLRPRREGSDGGVAETLEAGALEQVGHQRREALIRADLTGEAAVGIVGQAAEDRGDVLECLALEQPGEQQVALFPQRQLLVEVDVGPAGQQAPGLELDERGRDQQELGRDVEVEVVQPLDLGQVGVDDGRQADLVDVDFFGQDQPQQQVERAVEDGGGDVEGHHDHATEPTRTRGG
jgi:hypothetical protein